jgi:anti-sigma factor (TIGR02949 family)
MAMAHEHEGHPESCKEVFARLSEYLDAELPPGSCEEIQKHLADCPPCIEFLESLKGTIGLCRDCEVSEPPEPIGSDRKEELRAAYRKFLAARQS